MPARVTGNRTGQNQSARLAYQAGAKAKGSHPACRDKFVPGLALTAWMTGFAICAIALMLLCSPVHAQQANGFSQNLYNQQNTGQTGQQNTKRPRANYTANAPGTSETTANAGPAGITAGGHANGSSITNNSGPLFFNSYVRSEVNRQQAMARNQYAPLPDMNSYNTPDGTYMQGGGPYPRNSAGNASMDELSPAQRLALMRERERQRGLQTSAKVRQRTQQRMMQEASRRQAMAPKAQPRFNSGPARFNNTGRAAAPQRYIYRDNRNSVARPETPRRVWGN